MMPSQTVYYLNKMLGGFGDFIFKIDLEVVYFKEN